MYKLMLHSFAVLWSYNSTSHCNTINISVHDQELDVGIYEFICSIEDLALSSASSVAVEGNCSSLSLWSVYHAC